MLEHTAAMRTTEQQQRLEELVKVFTEENKKLNLSAFRTEEMCRIGNVEDSLSMLSLVTDKEADHGYSVLDIGTGGGFPLLALAVCLPKWRFTGLDSVQKKIDAIERITKSLKLENVQLISGRAEELAHDAEYREQFDIVTARAVAPANTLLEYAAGFVKPKGRIIFWKSLNISQEMQDSLLARAELSCHLVRQYEYDLEGDWGRRQLLIFEKTSPTPKKYPRAVGVPKKDPIL